MTVITIAGRTVELNDSEAENCLRRLVFVTRQYVWLNKRFRFDDHYRCWQQHARSHSFNIALWAVEAMGGARLPPAGNARALKRQRDQIDRTLSPRSIDQFYQRFGAWNANSTRFCNNMQRYRTAMQIGTARTIRVLEVTRDASFMTLQIAAGFLTGGSSAAASGVVATMARGAAQAFVIHELEAQATRLGRAMAGQNVTMTETAEEAANAAVTSLTDAMLGDVVGNFMDPLIGIVESQALREISRGNIAAGVSMQVANSVTKSAVTDAINNFIRARASDVRTYLQNCQQSRGPNACAGNFGTQLMRNRAFRADLSRRIERAAA